MISIDYRDGSGELAPLFKTKNIATEVMELPAADFAFEGCGPEGKRFLIGVERKELSDMLNSIRSGRLSGDQLIKMHAMYDRSYVIVEGVFRCGFNGVLEVPRRVGGKAVWQTLYLGQNAFMYSMLDRYIISVEETYRGHVRFHRTSNKEETSERIVNMYIEWQKKYEHRYAFDAVVDTHVEIKPWSLTRRVAERLPGIGAENSLVVEKHFGSVFGMANAKLEEWESLEMKRGEGTRKLGKSQAKKIHSGIRGQ